MGSFPRRSGLLAAILLALAQAAGASVQIQVVSGVNGVNPGPDGTLYMFGQGTSSPTPGAYLSAPPSGFPSFLTRYDPVAGRILYTTYLNFYPSGVSIDSTGAAYLIGTSPGPGFSITPGAYNRNLAGGEQLVIAKLNPAGTALQFATLLGGSSSYVFGSPAISGIALGADGSIFVTGTTCAQNFPVTPDAFQAIPQNPYECNAFLSELSADASTLVYSTYLGASENSSGRSIAYGADGKVRLAGETDAPDFPTTPGTFTTPPPISTVLVRVFVAIWDPASRQFQALAAFGSGLNPLEFAWNGSRLAIGAYNLWDPLESTPAAIWPMKPLDWAVLVLDLNTWQPVYATGLPDETDVQGISLDAGGSVTIAGLGTDAIPPSAGAYEISGGPYVLQFDPTGQHILLATFFDFGNGLESDFHAAFTPNVIYVSPDIYTLDSSLQFNAPLAAIPAPPPPGAACAAINALPSVVQQCGNLVPQQILRWDACDPHLAGTAVHRDSPAGPVIGSTTSGSLALAPASTTYYLTDSSGNVLASEQTLYQPAARCSAVPNPQSQLTATPNPVLACTGNPPTGAQTSLASYYPYPAEIHVNTPDGPKLAYSPSGYVAGQTGDWVVDGTAFFLTPPASATPLAMDRVYVLPIRSCLPGAPPAPAAIQAKPERIGACNGASPAVLAWYSGGLHPVEIRASSTAGPVVGRFDAASGLLEVAPTATTAYYLAGYNAGVWQELGSTTVYCGGFPF